MESFAERIGRRSGRILTQVHELDDDTRVQLWNGVHRIRELLAEVDRQVWPEDPTEMLVLTDVWTLKFNNPKDERPGNSKIWLDIKEIILQSEWFEALDIIEDLAKYIDNRETHNTANLSTYCRDHLNSVFEHHLVGYRFIGAEITPIDSLAEAESVRAAQEDVDAISGARHSLEQAVEHLADRENPDYANSVKESISAVEAVVKKLTGEGTLSRGLSKLETAGLTVHPAMLESWKRMYGWSSDDSGIRHGDIEATKVDQALAKYILITCSAFVSYLVEEARKCNLI